MRWIIHLQFQLQFGIKDFHNTFAESVLLWHDCLQKHVFSITNVHTIIDPYEKILFKLFEHTMIGNDKQYKYSSKNDMKHMKFTSNNDVHAFKKINRSFSANVSELYKYKRISV